MRNSQRRKRNFIIFLFILVSFMFGSFYFFSGHIKIKGVGSTDDNFKVAITDVTLKNVTGLSADKSRIPSFADDRIEFFPFLNSNGESLTYTVTVNNQGALDAKYKFNPTLDETNPGVKFNLYSLSEWNILKAGDSNEFDVTIYYDSGYPANAVGTVSDLILTLESIQSTNENTYVTKDEKIDLPIFSEDGSLLKISYPKGCGGKYKCTYQKDGGKEVVVSKDSIEVKFSSSGTLLAKVSNGINEVSNSHSIKIEPIMMVWNDNSSSDFHDENYKAKISSVEFVDDISIPAGAKYWDVSYNKNGSVVAYVLDDGALGYKLYIGGKGGVIANNLSYLFYNFTNLKSVNLNKLYVTNCTSMKSTFESCASLESLDLRTFDTANTVVMSGMFKDCKNLKTIYVSNTFVTNQVILSKNMFLGCESLVGQGGMRYNSGALDREYANVGASGYFSTI